MDIFTWEELADSQDFEHGTKFVELKEYEKLAEKNKKLRAMAEEWLEKCERHDPGYKDRINDSIDRVNSLL